MVDADNRDRAPYASTGTAKRVVFDLEPGHIDDEKALHETAAQGAAAHGSGA